MTDIGLVRMLEDFLATSAGSVEALDRRGDLPLIVEAERVALTIDDDPGATVAAHEALRRIYAMQVTPPRAGTWPEFAAEESSALNTIRRLLERAFLESEERRLPRHLLADAPHDPRLYKQWLLDIVHSHPASSHEFYERYLPDAATAEDLHYFLAQESTIDAATDDFLALIQVGVSGAAKLEMATNYWDEMGNGDPAMVHSRLFSRALERFGGSFSDLGVVLTVEALLCGNLQLLLSLRRRHLYKAVGYFAVVEHMAPRRFRRMMEAWRRLGLGDGGADYYLIHIDVDEGHAAGWMDHVLTEMVAGNPSAAREVACGALLRLNTSKRYLDRVLPQLPSCRDDSRTAGPGVATSGAGR